jgi:hypothetical protein
MEGLDYQAFTANQVADRPFAHVIVPAFVPPALLASIQADLPAMPKRGSFPISALRLGPQAAALVAELEGPRFRAAVAAKFGLDLAGAPTMITLRGASGPQDGRIHCDSKSKRVTILLYLNQATDAWSASAGCLRLLNGPDDIEAYAAEVPPVNGTLLVFPNGPTTWHGHKPFIGKRYVLQLNYMASDRVARSELRRHKISAFFKRLAA